jgi:signal transduction histidine kinase
MRLQLEKRDLAALVRDVLESYTGLNYRVEAHLRSTIVQADSLRMEQVVRNLIDNAFKYGAPPVTVDVFDDAVGAWLIVRDHGPGVSLEHRPHLFDRFYQAERSPEARLRHTSGLGIGLWVTQSIVDQHNGIIRAEFPEDGGTRMVVRLPKASTIHRPTSSAA